MMHTFPAAARVVALLVLAVLTWVVPIWGTVPAAAQSQKSATQQRAQPAQPAGEGGLSRRVEQLEEQLVDMQVVIGTLESLARGATAPAAQRNNAGAALNAADAGRLDSIETQINALTAQLEQLRDQVRVLSGRSGSLQPNSSTQALTQPGQPKQGQQQPGFGATVVQSDEPDDEIGRILGEQQQPGAQQATPKQRIASQGAPDTDVSPKQLYESAYGYLLQRDYGAAESAFEDFLRRFPNDPLGANAQYWLGESLYVRGQYRAAAAAFLKGYQTYAKSPKAPESLLKLAMSLQRLGQKDAACTSFTELTSKFPNAPAHVKSTATAERQRAGCS